MYLLYKPRGSLLKYEISTEQFNFLIEAAKKELQPIDRDKLYAPSELVKKRKRKLEKRQTRIKEGSRERAGLNYLVAVEESKKTIIGYRSDREFVKIEKTGIRPFTDLNEEPIGDVVISESLRQKPTDIPLGIIELLNDARFDFAITESGNIPVIRTVAYTTDKGTKWLVSFLQNYFQQLPLKDRISSSAAKEMALSNACDIKLNGYRVHTNRKKGKIEIFNYHHMLKEVYLLNSQEAKDCYVEPFVEFTKLAGVKLWPEYTEDAFNIMVAATFKQLSDIIYEIYKKPIKNNSVLDN